jgi:subtilase family serine protease/methionine-rich copper-binding protein CopC
MSHSNKGLENLELRLLLSGTPLPMDDVAPSSSLVRSSPAVIDSFTAPAQTDSYEVTVDAGQTLTVEISPLDPSLLASVTVTPGVGSPTTAFANAANEPAIIQTLVTSAGVYTIDIANVSGLGNYTVRAVINSAVEVEAAGGPDNDTPGSAQSLDASVTPLPSALGGSRFAVRGLMDPSDTDVYALSLTAGQSLSVAVEGLSPEIIQIELLDPAGNVLTLGGRGADTVDARISNFVAPSAGTYFIRVTGYATEPYTLFGTIDAQMGYEPDDISGFIPQAIKPGLPLLAHLGDGAGVTAGTGMTTDLFSESNDTIYSSGYVDFYESEVWHVTGEIGDNYDLFDPLYDVDFIELGYLETGTLFTADLDSSGIGYGLDSRLRLFDSSGNEIAVSDDDPAPGESFSGDSYIEWTIDYDDYYYLGISSYDNYDYDPYTEESGSSSGASQGYYELTLAINGAAGAPDTDRFDFAVNPGDSLTVTVDGLAPDMFVQVELLDRFGNLLADDYASGSDDATATFNVPGTADANEVYTVRIGSQTSAMGAYVLRVDGATGVIDPSVQTIALPVRFPNALPDIVSFPQNAYVYLAANVDPDSVDVGDLLITGPGGQVFSATSVTVRDGGSLSFGMFTPNAPSGEYTLEILTGALTDLNGQPLQGYSRTFTYREEGPRVISSTLADGAVLSPGGLNHTVEFSEELLDFVSAGFFGYIVLTGEDVELTNLLTGDVRNPTNFSYTASPVPRIDTFFGQLDEGLYELRYLASASPDLIIGDAGDNDIHISGLDFFPLDGSPNSTLPSGDGHPGDDYVLYFSVDRPTNTPLPAFYEVGPSGGRVHTHDPLRGAIGEASDVDTFVLDADAGQKLSFRLKALAPELQMHVRVLDPGGAVLLDTVASAAGDSLLIQPTALPVSGQYVIEITSAAGVGGYELQATLNAALQVAGNDSIGNAQSLDGSAIALGNGAEHLAVTGNVTGTDYHDSRTITGTVFSPNLLTFKFAPGPNPIGPVTLTFDVDNLSIYDANQYLEVTLEGLSQQDIFVYFGNSGPATLTLSADEWRALTADGETTIRVKPSPAVSGTASSALHIDVDYITAADADFYKLSLSAGQSLDVVANWWNQVQLVDEEEEDPGSSANFDALALVVEVEPEPGGVAFELLNAAGVVLAASYGGDGGSVASLTGFVAPAAGEYYLRVVGDGPYALTATRDALFNLERDGDRALTTQAVLGALGRSSVEGRTIRVAHLDMPAIGGSSNDANRLINQLNDTTVFDFNAVRLTAGDITSAADLAAYDVIVTAGVEGMRNAGGISELLRAFVEGGGGLVLVGDAPWLLAATPFDRAAADIDAVSPIHLSSARATAPNNIDILDIDHPITAGLNDFAPGYSTVGTQRGAVGKPGSIVLGRSGGVDTVVYRLIGEVGRSVYLGSVYEADHSTSNPLRSGSPDQLLEQAVAGAAAGGDHVDRYTIELTEGQTITLQTATPAGGIGEPVNDLDPALQLLDAAGNVVAGDSNGLDGRNAFLTYTVPVAGAGLYTIAVNAEGLTGGSYVLLTNATTSPDTTGPSVVSTAPFDGQRFAQPPAQLTVTFDEAIDLTTVDTSDLTLTNGGTVTGFQVVDGKTVRYLLNVPDTAGDFGFTLNAGAVTDLAGNANTEASGVFTIDRTGPKVIAQTPGTQAAAPFNTITLTFDEPIDADTVSIQDVTAFTGPGGTNLLAAIQSVSASGDKITVTFTNQLALGTYTLTIGPNITDSVGQVMDQNGNGTGGEATDSFTATLSIQSPNLTVESVVPGPDAEFGSTLELTYTVRNNGTDDAVEGWIDRIYLSTDGTIGTGDRLLLEVDATTESPLLAGDAYTRTVTLNLPLTASLLAGDYQILVRTDALNTQPEDSELDNVGSTGVIPITLPALPDLVITQITTPPSPQLTGGPIEISWTIHNQGDGDATGTIYDDVYLSTDNALNSTSDRFLGRFARTGTIAAGESIVRTQLVNIPVDKAGDFYIIVRTDATNSQYEHVGDNNNITPTASPITFQYPPLPDLTVIDITAPSTALSNEIVTVTWTVYNNGTADFVGQFTDRVWISPDAAAGGDQSLGDFIFDGAIPAGGSVTRSANVKLPPDLSGDRYFVVTTDFHNQVFEHTGEGNNATADDTPVAVTRSPFPNLVVTLVTAPPIAFSGQSFDVTWRVSNIGDAPTSAANWRDQLYLSTNGQLDGLDINLGSKATPAFLNPGESYEQTMTVTVPDGVQGPRYLLVVADSNNRVFELDNESDNIGASQLIDVQLTPPPDLQVINVDAPPAAFSGQPMTLRWTVRNEGLGATVADKWYDRVWFSADDTLDGLDILLGEFVHNGVLAPDGFYTAEHNVALPIALTGPYYFIVETDRRNQVFEFAFEGNNVGVDPNPTDILLTPPPDLVVSSIVAPTEAEAGRQLSVSFHVSNDGATGTPNDNWTDRVYLSLDGIFDPNEDILLGSLLHRNQLEPGEGYDVSASFRIPDGISGEYTLFVVSDQSNQVFELDNNNNIGSPAFTIDIALTPPDLVVTQVDAPAITAAGMGMPLKITVENQGLGDTTTDRWYDDIYLSSTGNISGALRLTSILHTSGLALNDSYTIDLSSLNIPLSVAPGNYFLLISLDDSTQAYELDDANNFWSQPITIVRDTADLAVTSITPVPSAFSGQAVNIEWTVTNQGTATTNATTWTDRVFLSLDPALGGSADILIGEFQRTNPLGAGQSYTRNESIFIPDGLTGDYYIVVQTDERDRVYEAGSESNNVLPADNTTAITPAPAADLVVESVDIPASAYSGRNIAVTYTTRNDGTAPVNKAIYESVYLSADRLLDSGDVLMGTYLEPLNLGVGASREVTRFAKLPVGVTGSFYVLVRTDASNRVYETAAGELNNIGYEDQVISIALAPPVDLVAGTITLPVSATAGQDATITYTVTNDGPNTAVGPWTDTLYLSTDPTWDINDRRFAEVQRQGNVLSGQSYSGTATAPLPGLLPGNYYVIVRSDILNQVIETDETNNASASLDAFALDIPTLALDTATSITLRANRFNYFAIDLPDDQTFVLDVDALGADIVVELFAREGDVPARDRFDFAVQNPLQADSRLVIPDTVSGRYYIGVYGTSVPGFSQTVELTARLVPFSILDTSYGRAGNAGDRTLQINGARFDRTIQARLLGTGVNRAATAMYPVNEARAYATFDLRGLTPGFYDVLITKEDGSTDTLTDAVEVVTGGGGTSTPRLIGPSAVTIATRQFPVTAVWGNDGLNDSLAPLLYVEASNLIGDTGEDRSASFLIFYGAGLDDGPAGILRPDQASSRPLASGFAGAGAGSSTTIIDRLVEDTSRTYDWEPLRDILPRMGMDEAGFNASFDQMVARNGNTWGDYLAMLSRNAGLLPAELGDNRNPEHLAALELRFAAADLGNAIVGKLHAPDFAVDISGIKVTAGDDNGKGYTTVSLNDGTFIFFNMAPGTYTFNAQGARVINDPAVSVALTAGQTVRDVILDADAGIATARARVLDADANTALPNIFVTLYDTDTNQAVFQTRTDASGFYDMQLAPTGTFRAVVHTDGYARRVIDDFVIEFGVTPPDILLTKGASVTATLDFNGQSAAAETFILAAPDLADPSQDVFDFTTTSSFVIDGLTPGTYTFWVFNAGFGERIDGVVIGETGLVDLGTITFAPPPPTPPGAASGQGAEQQAPNTGGSGWTSVIDAEKVYSNTGGALYPTIAIMDEALDRIKTSLLVDWITIAKFKWGSSAAGVWQTFLGTDPEFPSSRITFGEGSDIVEGTWVVDGFREQDSLQFALDSTELFAGSFFRQQFANGTYSIDSLRANGRQVVEFKDITPAFENANGANGIRDYNYSDLWDIPGNLAGGAGSPGQGTGKGGGLGQVYTDIREVDGFAILTAIDENTARVKYVMRYRAADTVDFVPGNPGASIEQVVTRRLWALEIFGKAFDVPFIVEYPLDWADVHITRTPRDPSSPDGPHDFTLTTVRRRSGDPNDILGPDGFGPEKFVPVDQPLDYTIRFENDPNLADAPAQEIIITTPLDDNLDARTFRLGDIQLSETLIDVPDNRAFYQTRIDLTETRGVFVDVFAGINLETNEAFWRFTSIDPGTGELPFDPLMGLLPVNDDTGVGEGFVQYSVRAKSGAVTGDVIDAQATIVFDVNGPIDTPAIFNTFDASAPTSAVAALPATAPGNAFEVAWSGLDESDGSGIESYDIYVAINGGAFTLWLGQTTQTSATYTGQPGHTYAFYSVARDNVGNVEQAPATPDAVTTVAAVGAPPVISGYQVNPDSSQQAAVSSIAVGFDSPVNLAAGAFELTHVGSGQPVPYTVTLAADRLSATIDFSGAYLGDGMYQLRVLASGVTNDSGTPLANDGVFNFHRLFADTNGDRFVGIYDLNLILGNWGNTVPIGDLSQGDITGDGFVGMKDLNALLGNWNASLPAPPPAIQAVEGDLDGDGFVGIADLNLVLGNWNTDGSADTRSDPSGDGFVGIEDLNKVLGNWNAGTPPVSDVSATVAPVSGSREPGPTLSVTSQQQQAQQSTDPAPAASVTAKQQPQKARRQLVAKRATPQQVSSLFDAPGEGLISSALDPVTRAAFAAWSQQAATPARLVTKDRYTPWSMRHETHASPLGLWDESAESPRMQS